MATVQQVYIALFGRPADPGGLAYWQGVTGNGANLSAMLSVLAPLPEYQQRFAGLGPNELVNSVFRALFNRDADAGGLAFFVGELNAGRQTLATIAVNVLDGAQGTDLQIIQNKTSAADRFTLSLDLPQEQASYSGQAAADIGRSFLSTVTASTATVPTTTQTDQAILRLSPATLPTLTASATSVDEGGTVVFTLQAANAIAGTEYSYTITGINAQDITGGLLTGTVRLDATGRGTVQAGLVGDNLTEGQETLIFSAAGQSASVLVNDTSRSLGRTNVLTTGQDNIVGTTGDDVIQGVIDTAALTTVQTTDFIDGGAGFNTVKIQSTKDIGALTIPKLTNIQRLELVLNPALTAPSVDLTNVSPDLKQLKIEDANSTLNLKLAPNMSLSIEIGGALKTLTIQNAVSSSLTLLSGAGVNSIQTTGPTSLTVDASASNQPLISFSSNDSSGAINFRGNYSGEYNPIAGNVFDFSQLSSGAKIILQNSPVKINDSRFADVINIRNSGSTIILSNDGASDTIAPTFRTTVDLFNFQSGTDKIKVFSNVGSIREITANNFFLRDDILSFYNSLSNISRFILDNETATAYGFNKRPDAKTYVVLSDVNNPFGNTTISLNGSALDTEMFIHLVGSSRTLRIGDFII